jgi:HEAT repeat protein
MPVTMQQVLAEIDKDEPNYAAAAGLGWEALPHLQMIIEADDPLRAAKAAYAASLIGGMDSPEVLRKAAAHRDPQVRLAMAHGLKNSASGAPTELLKQLLEDGDPGVRKVALGTVEHLAHPELRDIVTAISERDPEDFVRKAAANAARKYNPK